MSATAQGSIVLVATLLMLLSGVPVAFGLGLLVLQYAAELICLVTGRTPPFGITADRVPHA